MARRRFYITIPELLLLIALGAILIAFYQHVDWWIHGGACVAPLDFSPDGKLLASSTDRGIVVVFDANTSAARYKLRVPAFGAAFSPDGKRLATGGTDGSLMLWDAASGRLRSTLTAHGEMITSLAFSADSKVLASASNDGTVKVWDIAAQRLLWTLQPNSGRADGVAFAPQGSRLAVGCSKHRSNSHTIEIWDTATQTLQLTMRGPEYCYVGPLAFSPDGKILAAGLSIPTIRFWNVEAGTELAVWPDASSGNVLKFSPDGSLLASIASSGANVWDARTGHARWTLGVRSRVSAVEFLDGGRTLAAAATDGTATRWDLASGDEIAITDGLTTSPGAIPWTILGVFAGWTVLWFRANAAGCQNGKAGCKQTDVSAYLVAVTAAYSLANGLVLISLLSGGDSAADPIGLTGLLSSVACCTLLGMLFSVFAFRTLRGRLLFSALSLAMNVAVLLFNGNLWVQYVASV